MTWGVMGSKGIIHQLSSSPGMNRGPGRPQSLEGPRGQLGQLLCGAEAEETPARGCHPRNPPGNCFPAPQALVPGPADPIKLVPLLLVWGTWVL